MSKDEHFKEAWTFAEALGHAIDGAVAAANLAAAFGKLSPGGIKALSAFKGSFENAASLPGSSRAARNPVGSVTVG